MPRQKLTVRAIDRLAAPDPSGKQTLYWDTELRGFGVLVSGTTGSKSYIVQRDLPDGRSRRVTIAPVNVLGLDDARERAKTFSPTFTRASIRRPDGMVSIRYARRWRLMLRAALI